MKTDGNGFEGTLILERLAEAGRVDAFFEAIDSDDLAEVRSILKSAEFDSETIAMVLKMIAAAGGDH